MGKDFKFDRNARELMINILLSHMFTQNILVSNAWNICCVLKYASIR